RAAPPWAGGTASAVDLARVLAATPSKSLLPFQALRLVARQLDVVLLRVGQGRLLEELDEEESGREPTYVSPNGHATPFAHLRPERHHSHRKLQEEPVSEKEEGWQPHEKEGWDPGVDTDRGVE